MSQAIRSFGHWLDPWRGRLVVAIVLIVGLYFVVAFGNQAWKARQLRAEVAARQAVIARMEADNQSLKQQTQSDASSQYLSDVEQIARRDLNLAHPGETVLLIRWHDTATPAPAAGASAPAQRAPEPNWRKWVDLFR